METIQTETVSTFRDNYRTALTKLRNGPVLLMQNSKVAAVLVSQEAWNAQAKELKELRFFNEAREAWEQVKRGEAKTISHDELKRLMLEKSNVGN